MQQSPRPVDRFFEAWSPRLAERNLLVSFAGARYNGPLVDSEPASWRACVESSLLSTHLMTRGFARVARTQGGAILNMASIHAEAAAAGTPHPARSLGDPADVTRASLFLLSDESAFRTGETIRVDGGRLRHAEV